MLDETDLARIYECCGQLNDLLAEFADVIITAVIAMTGITGDVDEARSHLERCLSLVTERAGVLHDLTVGLRHNPGR